MAVPDFQTVMLPLRVLMGEGSKHSLAEVIENLGNRLGLSPEKKSNFFQAKVNRDLIIASFSRKAVRVVPASRQRP
jgi:restriction endonuclease Mrr